jgi:hypothetical protein
MQFTTLSQAMTFVTQNLQSITETLFEPDEDACKYIAAWIMSKQGARDKTTVTNVLQVFSQELDSGTERVTMDDVLSSDAFDLGEFFDDDEESDRYALEFKRNQEQLGLYLD